MLGLGDCRGSEGAAGWPRVPTGGTEARAGQLDGNGRGGPGGLEEEDGGVRTGKQRRRAQGLAAGWS